MSGDFIDSNVFVYLFDSVAVDKYREAERLITEALGTGSAAISYQVVQEVLNVLGRQRPAAAIGELQQLLDEVLMPLCRVMPSHALYEKALDIRARYAFSFFDSLIVAAAIHSGASRLLSEDLQHGQRIEGLTITNPFRAAQS